MQNDASHLHSGSREGSLPQHQQDVQPQQQKKSGGGGGGKNGGAGGGHRWQQLSRDAYLLTADEVLRELQTDPDSGLSEATAKSRLAESGLNELEVGGGVNPMRILMGQIFNAMVLVSSATSIRLEEIPADM